MRVAISKNKMYNNVNRQNETADCASRSHIFIYKHKTHTTPYFLYADTFTVATGPHLFAPDWTMDMSIVAAAASDYAVELLLLVDKQSCADFLSWPRRSTTNAGRLPPLLHNQPAAPSR